LPFPFPDALQEFSVETSSLPARNGLHPGGLVNIVTKSGANAFHGNLFEFLRNGAVNARNFFAPVHDSLKRNQFGGPLGGNNITDNLFFFGGYQGTRNRQNPPSTTSFVPTAAAIQGDFSVLDSAKCRTTGFKQLVDPTNNQPFANNFITTGRFDKASVKLLSYLPVPSDPCGKLVFGIPVTGDEDQEIGRIDYVQNSKHSLFGRYFVVDYRNPAFFDAHNIQVTNNPRNLQRAQALTLGDTYTFSPTLLNS